MSNSILSRARSSAALMLAYLSVFSLVACNLDVKDSNQVSQAEIYQSYSLTYDEGPRLLSSTAQFLAGGPSGESVDLQSPSKVTFDGAATRKQAILGLTYVTNAKVDFSPTHTWLYTDNDGKTYSNTITLVPIAIDTFPTDVDLRSDFNFTFDGPVKVDDETIEVNFDLKAGSYYTRATFSAEVKAGARAGVIQASDLASVLPREYSAGSGTVQLVRRKSRLSPQAGHGAVWGIYYSTKSHVNVTR